jgi:hypothetical protein
MPSTLAASTPEEVSPTDVMSIVRWTAEIATAASYKD